MVRRRKKQKKITFGNYDTDHHIIPKSRGGSNLENIARVPDRDHKYYHALFSTQIPQETIKYLVENFWGGKWDYVAEAYDLYEK